MKNVPHPQLKIISFSDIFVTDWIESSYSDVVIDPGDQDQSTKFKCLLWTVMK